MAEPDSTLTPALLSPEIQASRRTIPASAPARPEIRPRARSAAAGRSRTARTDDGPARARTDARPRRRGGADAGDFEKGPVPEAPALGIATGLLTPAQPSPSARLACRLWRMTWAVAQSADLVDVDRAADDRAVSPTRAPRSGVSASSARASLHARRFERRDRFVAADARRRLGAARRLKPRGNECGDRRSSALDEILRAAAEPRRVARQSALANRVVTAATCQPICAADQPPPSAPRSAAPSLAPPQPRDQPLVRFAQTTRAGAATARDAGARGIHGCS